jgi:hypothetical protein
MAITTLDGVIAGMQPNRPWAKGVTPTLVAGRPHSLWYLAGSPGAGLTPANTAGGVALTNATPGAVAGVLPRTDPGSGNAYLGRLSAMAGQAGTLLLCDRLMQVGGNSGGTAISVTTTTAQTINTGALPARDDTGTVNGVGVQWGLEIITATGAGTATPSLNSYTNSAGTTAHSASLIDTYVASSAIGAFYRFGLQAGDVGIKSVEQLTLSVSMTSGSIALVAYRVLAALELGGAFIPNAIDALTSGFPRIYNGCCPFFIFIPNTTTAVNLSGTYLETQG